MEYRRFAQAVASGTPCPTCNRTERGHDWPRCLNDSRSERNEVLEEAAKVVEERTRLWATRWGQNIRPEFREEAGHRKDAVLALGQDAAAAIRALITPTEGEK